MGPDASDTGANLYMRGTNYNAKHLDKFINSSVNVRFSSNNQRKTKLKNLN